MPAADPNVVEVPIVPQPLIVRGPHLYPYDATYQLDDNIEAELFAYEFPVFGPMTAALVQQQQVIIQANKAFEMREIVYYWNLANAAFVNTARPIPNVSLQLQESGSGQNLFNAAVPLDSIAPTGENRRRALIWPRLFMPNTTITATLTNFDAAVVTGLCRLTLIGRHLFRLAR
ncbi:MAG: hypothetical protein ACREDH_12245 [Methylocella sp.]